MSPATDPFNPPPPFVTLTIAVVECGNNNPLPGFFFKNFNTGEVIPSAPNSNLFTLLYAYPGFKFEISKAQYEAKEHILTSEEVGARFAEVCLNYIPPSEPPKKPICLLVSAVLGVTDEDEGPAREILDICRRWRDLLNTTKTGGKLVDRYYSDELSRAGLEALGRDPELKQAFSAFLLELSPYLGQMLAPRGQSSTGPEPAVTLDGAVAQHGLEVLRQFARATGGTVDDEVAQASQILRFASGRSAGEIHSFLSGTIR